MSERPLVIIGNGEIAAMAGEYFLHDTDRAIAAYSIGEKYITEPRFCDREVVPLDGLTARYPPDEVDIFVAIGDAQLNRVRRRHFDWAKTQGYRLASYVSSRAFVWHNARIGENCLILEHNVIQPFVEIGDNVILWSGNHIGHRSKIEDDVFISSHVVISGYCEVGRHTFMGVNSATAHGVRIAEDNYIGMGAVINASTEPDKIYQGNPAEARKLSAKRFARVVD